MAESDIKIDLLQHLGISVAGLHPIKFAFYQIISKFFIFVVIVILILLRTTFSQILIHGQLEVKIL